MSRGARNTTFWMKRDEGLGPADYNIAVLRTRETFNTGAVPFGVCKDRFHNEIPFSFRSLPGPGYYNIESFSKEMDNAKGIKNTYNSIFKSKVPKIENIKMKKQINTNPTDSVNDSSKHTADSKYKSLTKNGHISKIVKQNQRFNNKLLCRWSNRSSTSNSKFNSDTHSENIQLASKLRKNMKIRFGLETADSSAVSNLSKPTIPSKTQNSSEKNIGPGMYDPKVTLTK